MTWLWWILLLFFVGQPVALFFGYSLGIQYQRESWPQWARNVCEFVAGFALLIDVLANWTVLSIYLWEWPRWKQNELQPEWTFSTRLERLWFDTGWRGRVARPIARLLNWIAPPGHPHIKNAA
jgi:hypothetical protein